MKNSKEDGQYEFLNWWDEERARRKVAWTRIEEEEAEFIQSLIIEGRLRGVSLEGVRERLDMALEDIENW